MFIRLPQKAFNSVEWKDPNFYRSPHWFPPTIRQQMISDLASNGCPGKNRQQLTELLGASPSHEAMRRHSAADFRASVPPNTPYPRTGTGFYFDEYDWDLIYPLGKERIWFVDHKGEALSSDEEWLLLRVDEHNIFSSWFIYGSKRYLDVVDSRAKRTYRNSR